MNKYKKVQALLLVIIILFISFNIGNKNVLAQDDAVYECTINPSYAHPISGSIEDSGGEKSIEIGSGMVNGTVYNHGIFEITSEGKMYLTFRMSLIDFTSNHSYQKQITGQNSWKDVDYEVIANGKDANGNTADISLEVDGKDTIIRVKMYVEPMGRDVIFYLYPSNYKIGNNTDFEAIHIDESNVSQQQEELESDQESTSDNNESNIQYDEKQQKVIDKNDSISSQAGLDLSTANKDYRKASINENIQESTVVMLTVLIVIIGILAVVLLILIIIYVIKAKKRREEILNQENEYDKI